MGCMGSHQVLGQSGTASGTQGSPIMAINGGGGGVGGECAGKKSWNLVVLGIVFLFFMCYLIFRTDPFTLALSLFPTSIFTKITSIFSETDSEPAYRIAALEYHNKRRAEHQVGPLELDAELNSKALKCAEYYSWNDVLDYSCKAKGDAGESLEKLSGSKERNATEEASKRWYKEAKYYDFDYPGFDKETRHFTAMLWKASTKMGIGFSKVVGSTYVVALYTPKQNEYTSSGFKENVLPKKSDY